MIGSIQMLVQGELRGALAHLGLQQDVLLLELVCFLFANESFCGDFGTVQINLSAMTEQMERWPLHS